MHANNGAPTEHRDSFYNPCCGLESFLGHTEDCVNALPPVTRYRRINSSEQVLGTSIWACRRCGSLVDEHRAHDRFHDSEGKC